MMIFVIPLCGKVDLGIDCFFRDGHLSQIKGKNVALLLHQASRDSQWKSTEELFVKNQGTYRVVALFAPEHGLYGLESAGEAVTDSLSRDGIVCYSLFGKTRRPTAEMLKGVDVLICDLQDIGVRSYTYATTLFYCMEEAAKHGIEVIVLDRPNPLGGELIDGPMVNEEMRSFIGYINVPYCHGMTIGELARFFKSEYQIGCTLQVISMKGWARWMTFASTGLHWIPTSPNIPEFDTPFYYASTGILGTLNFLNLGGGLNLPFKIVAAPWIDAERFARSLNEQKLPGIYFLPFHGRPLYGSMNGKECHGVKLMITDQKVYRPVMVQYMILGILKSLYSEQLAAATRALGQGGKELLCKANGNRVLLEILDRPGYIAWPLIQYQEAARKKFAIMRTKYLLY